MKETKYPRSFSHIGITVPNIKKAVKFYSDVMGWYIIMEPSKVTKEKETAIGQMCIDVFGEDWKEFEIAHMSTSDGIGIELFSFPHGIKEAPEFNPFNTGLFHFCIQGPNIEELIDKIVSSGGDKGCLSENIIQTKSLSKCAMSKIHLELFLKSTHLVMN
jgi:predicted enzyme related to lactoylglutathione lyase